MTISVRRPTDGGLVVEFPDERCPDDAQLPGFIYAYEVGSMHALCFFDSALADEVAEAIRLFNDKERPQTPKHNGKRRRHGTEA